MHLNMSPTSFEGAGAGKQCFGTLGRKIGFRCCFIMSILNVAKGTSATVFVAWHRAVGHQCNDATTVPEGLASKTQPIYKQK